MGISARWFRRGLPHSNVVIDCEDATDLIELKNKFGYPSSVGLGSTVTQLTNRSTGVTINALTGQITTDTTSLAAEAAAAFAVTNSYVAAGDVIVLSIASGTNGGNTSVAVTAVSAGSFTIRVSNNNAAAGTAETGAIVINFAVIKAAAD